MLQCTLSSDQALRIAEADTLAAYGDLSGYRVILALEQDGWHAGYELKNQQGLSGGAHYCIDSTSRAILRKKHEQ